MRRWHLALLCLTLVSCSSDTPKNYLKPFYEHKEVEDDGNYEEYDPKVDILFVIDDSGSMETHQQNLSKNIGLFTDAFLKNSILDYNIGVITTDNDGLKNPCCGRLVGYPTVINRATPGADGMLRQRLLVGTDGSGTEAPFATTLEALSPNMLAHENANFIRENAAAIVIFITDAEDQSDVNGPDLMARLMELKSNNRAKILNYGAIIPTGENGCERDDDETPVRIEKFLKDSPNGQKDKNFVSLCSDDFGTTLADWALQIVKQLGSKIFLTRRPIPETLRVTYGTADLPKDFNTGWSYSPRENAIVLGNNIDWESQPVGSRIKVHYKEALEDSK